MTQQEELNFTVWLKECLLADTLELDERTTPRDIGYSNDTQFFTAHYTKNGHAYSERLVQRLAPSGNTVFRDYDLERQYRCMEYVRRCSSLPVPRMLGQCFTTSRPFYVMEFIEGVFPPDGYTAGEAYTTKGFLFEASEKQRNAYFNNITRCIADLHRVPVDKEFQKYLGRPAEGKSSLELEVEQLADLFHWGKAGQEAAALLAPYVKWLCENIPCVDDMSLLWGDARPANTLVKEFNVVAMLDWELAKLGPGESDLFFFLATHEHREKQMGANQLEGIPTEEELISLYEEASGRTVRFPEYFRFLSYVKMGVYLMLGCKSSGVNFNQDIFETLAETIRLEDMPRS